MKGFRRLGFGKRVLSVLAWISVGLSIPMATLSILDGISDAKWEAADSRWEREDIERHAKIADILRRIDARVVGCSGGP